MANDPAVNRELRAGVRSAQESFRAGDADSAVSILTQIIKDAPDFAPATFALANIFGIRGEHTSALTSLLALLQSSPTQANITAVSRSLYDWEQQNVALPGVPLRVALTGHGTLEPLGDHLRVALAGRGFAPALYVSGFDLWAQELLSADSSLYAFKPDVIGLRLAAESLFPRTCGDMSAAREIWEQECSEGIAQIAAVLDAIAGFAPTAYVLLHTFAIPDFAPAGVLDILDGNGQAARFAMMNAKLVSLANARQGRILLIDQERLEARHGKSRVRDERLWYRASVPYSESFLPVLAQAYVALCSAVKGRAKKCVVLDLDNTLWGGVIGEDGLSGIKIGGTAAPGNAFADFQRALLELYGRGILLSVCSKNNPEDALPVFEQHPDMVLRKEHFAAMRINWQDKATNIAEIARELNIGRDSLVFLDDNPAERAMVREALPEVLTVDLPRDPALYATTVRGLDVFESLALTEEDRQRTKLYQAQKQRQEFASSLGIAETEMGAKVTGESADLRVYLKNLGIVCTISELTEFTAPRVAQLLGKTNQFNVTTRRHTELHIRQMMADKTDWGIWTISVADRFGDSGLTGVAIARKTCDVWELDSFLLSCRVLGRGVEDALLTRVIHAARSAGAHTLRGLFLPTAKNAPASGFFDRQGMERIPPPPDNGQGPDAEFYELRLDSVADRTYPEWMQVVES